MRSWLLLLAVGLVGLVESSSNEAYVQVFDQRPHEPRHELSTIRPRTSRLLFAQWLGVSEFHGLGDLQEPDMEQLGQWGSHQTLLANWRDEKAQPSRLLLFIEGVEDIADLLPKVPEASSMRLMDAPLPKHNDRLARALAQQLLQSRSDVHDCVHSQRGTPGQSAKGPVFVSVGRGCCFLGVDSQPPAESTTSSPPSQTLLDKIRQNSCPKGSASIIYVPDGFQLSEPQEVRHLLSEALAKFATLAKAGEQESIVVFFPPSSSKSKHTTDPYGDYALPPPSQQRLTRRATEEERLDEPQASKSDVSAAIASSSSSPKNSTTLKHGLPICHASLDACVGATNNCSSHGSCHKKYSSSASDGDGDGDGARKDCYACRCAPTVLRDSDTLVKTIYWGGNACQKKDVSAPFFLLAGISIVLVGAMTWAVALLFSVGQEPLPSVIGAGVALVSRAK